ncbi:MAG TPA: YdcF family protein, partial [Gemmataceae bacterium]|nr:YdcF family protein [Gemmataceae bacterium]
LVRKRGKHLKHESGVEPPHSKDHMKKFVLVVALLLVLILGLAFGLLMYDVYSYADNSNDADADAAIVLGAYVHRGKPTPAFRERIHHAVNLFQTGKVRYLILTGACPNGCELAESTVARQYALEFGVPANKILTETKSHTTYQNLYYAREAARSAGLTTFVIVSDPYHLRRAMRMADELGLDAQASATPTSKLNDADFLLSETLRNAKFLVHHALAADPEADELAISEH